MSQTTVKPRNPVERRSGSTEILLRITAIEVSQKYMTQMLETQAKQTCGQRGCTLNDEVVTLKTHMKVMKWAGGTAIAGVIGGVIRICYKAFVT